MKITKKQNKALDKGETNVRELFPEVFETEIKTGWFKHKNNKHKGWLCFIELENKISYGFGVSGNWIIDFCKDDYLHHYKYIQKYCEPATKEEVETALINEAKRRGFKEVVKVKDACFNDIDDVLENYFVYYPTLNRLQSKSVIFEKGVWAEIIKPKTMTKEEIEKELGYEIEIV